MADFTGQNIQDTYQRVIQIDGGRLEDGLGNPLPISMSGNDVVIDGTLRAQSYIVTESITVQTTGSTIFGNSPDDTHEFTGSLFVSGNITFPTVTNTLNGLYFQDTSTKIVGDTNYILIDGDNQVSILADNNIFMTAGNAVEIQSGDFKVTDGDISASGDIIGSRFIGDAQVLVLPNGTDSATFSNNNITSTLIKAGNDIRLGNNTAVEGHITASGNISGSAVGTVSAGSGSFHHLKGDTTQATGLFVQGTITASGDISSSGNVLADLAFANRVYIGPHDESARLTFDDTSVVNNMGLHNQGHITASGNISSSGDVYAESIILPFGQAINWGGHDGNHISVDSGTGNIIFDTLPVQMGNGLNVTGTNGHITASGNISSSGTGSFEVINIASTANSNGSTSPAALKVVGGVSVGEKINTKHLVVEQDFAVGNNAILGNASNDQILIYGTVGTDINSTANIILSGHITASGNIRSGGNLELTASAAGHITASGNISASGTIIGNGIYTDDIHAVGGSITLNSTTYTNNLTVQSGTTFRALGNVELGNALGDTIEIDGHITASGNIKLDGFLTGSNGIVEVRGNISASGTITADQMTYGSPGSGHVTLGASDGDILGYETDSSTNKAFMLSNHSAGGKLSLYTGNTLHNFLTYTGDSYVNGTNNANGFVVGGTSTDNKFEVVGTTKLGGHVTASGNILASGHISASSLISETHITASGNISASGTIYSKTPKYFAVGGWLKSTDAANYYGPHKQGTNNSTWNKSYGTDPSGTISRLFYNSGIIVPEDIVVTGFKATFIPNGIANSEYYTASLYVGQEALNNQVNNPSLVFIQSESVVGPANAGNANYMGTMVENYDSQEYHVSASSIIYPRFKWSDTSEQFVNLIVQYYRIER